MNTEIVNDEHKTKIDQLIPSLSFWSAANQSFPVSTSLPKSCHPNPLPAVHGATVVFSACYVRFVWSRTMSIMALVWSKFKFKVFHLNFNLRKRETFCLLLLGDTSEIRPLHTANPLLTARSWKTESPDQIIYKIILCYATKFFLWSLCFRKTDTERCLCNEAWLSYMIMSIAYLRDSVTNIAKLSLSYQTQGVAKQVFHLSVQFAFFFFTFAQQWGKV